MKRITVEVKPDHLQTLANVKQPIRAVSELIWNGLDADAEQVRVDLVRNQIDGLTSVLVADNGHGLAYDRAEEAFQNLGGSWKKNAIRTPGGRLMHGQLGKGRFKAFGIGSSVSWNTRYKENGALFEYSISGSSSRLGVFDITDVAKSMSTSSGTTVEVSVHKNYISLASDKAPAEIAEEFALYLRQYPKVSLIYDGVTIDTSSLIRNVADFNLGELKLNEDETTTAALSVVEWNRPADRAIFLCDESGVALHKMSVGIQAPGFEFTAYLKSPYIRKLDAAGGLLLEEIDPGLNILLEASRTKLREYFRQRAAETTSEVVAQWKKENIYPYEGEPASVIEKAERQSSTSSPSTLTHIFQTSTVPTSRIRSCLSSSLNKHWNVILANSSSSLMTSLACPPKRRKSWQSCSVRPRSPASSVPRRS